MAIYVLHDQDSGSLIGVTAADDVAAAHQRLGARQGNTNVHQAADRADVLRHVARDDAASVPDPIT